MANVRNDLIHTLSQTHSLLTTLTGALPDPVLDFHFAPNEWTIREILAHLVDDEMYVMRTRLERIIKEDKPDLAPHNETYWHTNRNKNRDQLDELLADFQTQRTASLGIMTMLRDADWKREGCQPEIGSFTAEEWLTFWIEHDQTHLEQIKKTIRLYESENKQPPEV